VIEREPGPAVESRAEIESRHAVELTDFAGALLGSAAMAEKKTHFGRAGEFFAMSEVLLRGWNVAVPVVDIGDDVFVINDSNKTTYRLQVKSCRKTRRKDGSSIAKFTVSRQQLRMPQEIELIYMFMIRDDASSSWCFLVVPRLDLNKIHRGYLEASRTGRGRGAPPKSDDDATTDALTFEVRLDDIPKLWGRISLAEFFNRWPDAIRPLDSGPGSVGPSAQ
jgi:hypothetical protein